MGSGERSGAAVGQALVTGMSVAAWVAVPDLAGSRPARAAAKTGILAASMAAFVALEVRRSRQAGQDGEGGTCEVAETPEEGADGSGVDWRTWATIAAASAASIGTNVAANRGIDRLAAWLERRGLARPRVVIGAAMGAVTAATEIAQS